MTLPPDPTAYKDSLQFPTGKTIVGAVSPWSDPGHWLLPNQPPNLWRRFWTWALLGWKWERP